LKGFNLTKELLYKLFARLDTPHRKGYLIMQDWQSGTIRKIRIND
jgi:hypothetical protein